jgi:hypothetical protein
MKRSSVWMALPLAGVLSTAPWVAANCYTVITRPNDVPNPCQLADIGTPCNNCTSDPIYDLLAGGTCRAPYSIPGEGRLHVCVQGTVLATQLGCTCSLQPGTPTSVFSAPIHCEGTCDSTGDPGGGQP